ncbi:MAG: type II secretion system protein GspD [Dissulfurispiraceae bacterium]
MKRRCGILIQLVIGILFSVVAITSAGIPSRAEETTTQGSQIAAAAQTQPVFQPQSREQLPPPRVAPVAPSAGRPGAEKKADVSFNFDDADIFDVIQTVFGDILKVNYMIDPKVRGRVNFRTVTPVTRDEVLPLIGVLLKMNGAGFVEDKGLYRIAPINEIPGTTPQVFVYPLQNTKAKHIASLLQSIFSGAAGPAAPGRFIPEAPAGPGAAGHPQPASTTAPATGGSAGFTAGTDGLVSKETKVYADEITNSLVVLATPDDYKFIEETIKKLDTPPRQVMIEVLIAEVTLTKDFQFGLEWVLSNTTSIKTKPFSRPIDVNGQIGQNSNLLNATPLSAGYPGFSYAATDVAGNVKALLNTMASNDLVTILASPHIIAADNLEAKIQIGSQVPIATSQMTNVTASTTSGSVLSTIQYQDVGTILKVKPQINESGIVGLEVSQEVTEANTQTVLGTQQFVFTKRAAQTNVVVNDGQTIVIGGLIQDNKETNVSGIPYLMDIPILGYLFGSRNITRTKTEIIVLLTPHVIKNQQEAGKVTTDYLDRLKGDTKDMKLNEFIKQPGDSVNKEPSK